MEVIQVGQHIQDAANLAEEVERPATDSATTHTLGTVAGDVMFLGCQVNQQNATLINARLMEVIHVGHHIQGVASLAEEVERPVTDTAPIHPLDTVERAVGAWGPPPVQQAAIITYAYPANISAESVNGPTSILVAQAVHV